MSRRLALWFLTLIYMGAFLAGCSGQYTETHIIPDTEEDQVEDQNRGLFDVKTIYPLSVLDVDDIGYGSVLGWLDPDTVVFLSGSAKFPLLKSIRTPFEKTETLRQLDNNDTEVTGMSPDGHFVSTIEGGKIKLRSLVGAPDKVIDTFSASEFPYKWMTWSNNSRFISYFVRTDLSLRIDVYDTVNGTLSYYALPGEKKSSFLFSTLKISDDGTKALIIDMTSESPGFILATLNGGNVEMLYRHLLNRSGIVSWINDDQIAYIGQEGTLYTYDSRNDEAFALLKRADNFQLSMDRKFIAYTKGEDELYVGKLQGNNILSEKSVYQGVIPSRITWSPDNGALLIEGRKTYATQSPEPAKTKPIIGESDYSPFIIEFQ